MPRILDRTDLPGCQSAVVQFLTGNGKEEIHLLYSLGREHGPGIIRDGKGPARIARIYQPYGYTENPVEQRIGTWFIDDNLRGIFLASPDFAGLSADAQNILINTPDYLTEFKRLHPARKLVGWQSFGDLTMNLWNVAAVKLPSGATQLIYLSDEKINDRVYSCVVKWKPDNNLHKKRVTIEFLRFSSVTDDRNPGVVRFAETDQPIADQIEFAASGKRLIRDGNVVSAQEIVDQFADVRHLLALPNLNPDGPLYLNTTTPLDPGRSRYYFGQQQNFDLWFGEAPLLQYRNTRRAAVNGVIELNRLESGASREQIQAALSFQLVNMTPHSLYEEVTNSIEPLRRGQWRFVSGDDGWVDIWLKPNIYPSNILGVTDNGDVICFAWQGSYTEAPGHTLIEDIHHGEDLELYGQRIDSTTTRLKMIGDFLGLKDAILLDEGSDVRLEIWNDHGVRQGLVSKNREQVRAMFLYSKPQE